ncbi:AfsR/SARP family transcriptional regulator [Kutzneria kofuensis]|jgi:DNA-binding SARP family transcriptional activator|uniref:DNA-binding SARP family transcriptional activator n=1 Tax=Kutzneria kofuensis TaxID=103725 RepID=A0A7W9KRJ0_9PSEU|nr:BTAD domain-containing putative transcriptional regulator [Kutzneria kofuensis]MBB5897108.1 DNA-binding SARP family transcriptional activator [Kutzneria kofuensis]
MGEEQVVLRLLGGFSLSVAGRQVALAPNAERLLAYLALEQRWITRAAMAAALWPDASERRASGNLRSTLWRIARVAGQAIVVRRTHDLHLHNGVQVDFVRASHQADNVESLATADALVADLLPGWPDDWVAVHRECFRQLRLSALESLCAHRRDHGRLREALTAGLTAVAADPLRESAYRELVAVHLADGNVAEALRQYHFYRQLLGSQLGLVPSRVMCDLVAPLLGPR